MTSGEAAAAFRAAWRANEVEAAAGEALPAELSRIAAAVLNVDGAGLSVIEDRFRVPLGASDAQAGLAEQLQFTAGEGPCLDAVGSRRPAGASEDEIRSRWPIFAEQFFQRTPYRAVMALPLGNAHDQFGALDLYMVDATGLAIVDVACAIEVASEITEALAGSDMETSISELTGLTGPRWLHAEPAQTRLSVWLAVGELMAAFDVDHCAALALLRAHAFATDSTVDEMAGQLNRGDLDTSAFDT